MTILTLVEQDAGTVAPASLEAIAMARDVAGPGAAVEAVAFGPRLDGLAAQLSKYGVARLHVVDHDLLGDCSPELWGASLAQLVARRRPRAVLAAASDRGNEVMAQAAARAGLAFASNCVAVSADPGWTVTRIRAGGMLLEDAELTAPVALVTVVPGTVTASEATETSDPDVDTFSPDLDGLVHSRLVDRTSRRAGVTLATARVVVSGGRGVGGADGFANLEDLADLLGGAVGCSRVATNNGWRPHSDQVGQTGTKVSPELYVACGISGATQHWVGCMGSTSILAVNTDAEAPMVTGATYAVIGDVNEVLSAVVEEVRRRTEGQTAG